MIITHVIAFWRKRNAPVISIHRYLVNGEYRPKMIKSFLWFQKDVILFMVLYELSDKVSPLAIAIPNLEISRISLFVYIHTCY